MDDDVNLERKSQTLENCEINKRARERPPHTQESLRSLPSLRCCSILPSASSDINFVQQAAGAPGHR